MAFFSTRTFSYAKDPEQPDSNQDFVLCDGEHGRAVIADGVSSALFSRDWARILSEDIAASLPPDFEDTERFAPWLADLRSRWFQAIDSEHLAWYQRPKLASGAFSTLLWFQLEPCELPQENEPEFELSEAFDPDRACFLLTGWTIGDSCLFHIRQDKPLTGYYDGTELMNVFPIEHSEDFTDTALALGSTNLGHDSQLRFTPLRRIVQEGDWLILATDALSQWLLRLYEAGISPNWNEFWNLTEADFDQEIEQMRLGREICYDDTTLAILYLGDKPVELPEPAAAEQAEPLENPVESREMPPLTENREPEEPAQQWTDENAGWVPAEPSESTIQANGVYEATPVFTELNAPMVPSGSDAGQPQVPAFQEIPPFVPDSQTAPSFGQPPALQPVPQQAALPVDEPQFQLIAPAFVPEESAFAVVSPGPAGEMWTPVEPPMVETPVMEETRGISPNLQGVPEEAQGIPPEPQWASDWSQKEPVRTPQADQNPETPPDNTQDMREYWIQTSSKVGNQMSEAFQVVSQKGAELADVAGERISEGMAIVGEKTQGVRKRLGDYFRSLWSKNTAQEEPETDEPTSAKEPPASKTKPNHPGQTGPNPAKTPPTKTAPTRTTSAKTVPTKPNPPKSSK